MSMLNTTPIASSNVNPSTSPKKPLIGISCCRSNLGVHDFHMVADKYIKAAVESSNAIPVLIPALGNSMLALLPHLDGLYLTGSYSNLEPHHYHQQPIKDNKTGRTELRDTNRDDTNLALIKAALKLGMPVLGVCRGFQEMNVALGGSLHQCLEENSKLFDKNSMLLNHKEDKNQTLAEQYSHSHNIELTEAGLLAEMMQGERQQQVNSLHGQGINQLAASLKTEALAPDGLIEGFSLTDNSSFFLGLQWHPEWQHKQQPFYQKIFTAFGQASAQYQKTK